MDGFVVDKAVELGHRFIIRALGGESPGGGGGVKTPYAFRFSVMLKMCVQGGGRVRFGLRIRT